MQPKTVVEKVSVVDLRVPTSDTLLGSDPFHKKPNYAAVLVNMETNTGLKGLSMAFTLGAGNDWIAHGVKDLAQLVVGTSLEEFCDDPGAFQRLFVDHHQLRWLGLTDAQIIATIEKMKAVGLDCYKIKVGEDLQHDLARLAFIREAIGNDANLMLDANQVWGVDESIAYMRKLVKFRPKWIEEPTARDDVLGYLKISEALKEYDIGVAAGEQVPSPVIFKQLLTSGAIRYCQIDATRLAGINDVMAVILMAAKYNISVCPHGGGIGLCNMIPHYALWDQICVAGRSDDRVVEYVHFLQDEVFVEPVRIDRGAYAAPTVPGWGLEMYDDFIREHTYPTGSVWIGCEASGGVTFLA